MRGIIHRSAGDSAELQEPLWPPHEATLVPLQRPGGLLGWPGDLVSRLIMPISGVLTWLLGLIVRSTYRVPLTLAETA